MRPTPLGYHLQLHDELEVEAGAEADDEDEAELEAEAASDDKDKAEANADEAFADDEAHDNGFGSDRELDDRLHQQFCRRHQDEPDEFQDEQQQQLLQKLIDSSEQQPSTFQHPPPVQHSLLVSAIHSPCRVPSWCKSMDIALHWIESFDPLKCTQAWSLQG